MTLKEIKRPFEQIIESNGLNLKEININNIITKYKESGCSDSICLSILFHEAWPALDSIYYNQRGGLILSAEECYDIFVDTFQYIIKSSPWENKDHKLYGEEKAFLRAMRTCIKHRKLNYLDAQFKQKRVANTGAISMDYLNEEFQEGYFFDTVDEDFDGITVDSKALVAEWFNKKKYLHAFIFDLILHDNVFNDNQFSIKKLRLALRHIEDKYIIYFSSMYNLNKEEVKYSLKYFINLSNENLNTHIEKCLQDFREDDIVFHMLF